MSEQLHKKIFAFLGGELARTEHRQAIRISLSSGSQPVRTWDRGEDTDPTLFELGRAESFATEIMRYAEEYAEGSGPGTHRFVVRTEQFLGGQARMAFRIAAADIDSTAGGDGDGTGEDTPSLAGLLAQTMRHNEVVLRTLLQISAGATQTLAKRLDANENYIARLLEDRHKAFDELETSRSEQQVRDLDSMKQISKDKRTDKVVEKLLLLGPAVANRIIGHNLVPGAQSPRDVMINDLADSLRPEQIQKIAGALEPQQQILLIELFETAKKAKAEAAKTTNGATTEKGA